MTDCCTNCRTALNDGNRPSPFSIQALRARRHGFDKPLCVECLVRLDEAEMPDAVTVAGNLMDALRVIIASRYAHGLPRKTLEEALRLFADRLKRDPQTAFTEANALDEEDD